MLTELNSTNATLCVMQCCMKFNISCYLIFHVMQWCKSARVSTWYDKYWVLNYVKCMIFERIIDILVQIRYKLQSLPILLKKTKTSAFLFLNLNVQNFVNIITFYSENPNLKFKWKMKEIATFCKSWNMQNSINSNIYQMLQIHFKMIQGF